VRRLQLPPQLLQVALGASLIVLVYGLQPRVIVLELQELLV